MRTILIHKPVPLEHCSVYLKQDYVQGLLHELEDATAQPPFASFSNMEDFT